MLILLFNVYIIIISIFINIQFLYIWICRQTFLLSPALLFRPWDLEAIHPSFLLKVIYGVDISVVIKLPYFLGVDQFANETWCKCCWIFFWGIPGFGTLRKSPWGLGWCHSIFPTYVAHILSCRGSDWKGKDDPQSGPSKSAVFCSQDFGISADVNDAEENSLFYKEWRLQTLVDISQTWHTRIYSTKFPNEFTYALRSLWQNLFF